MEELEKRGKWFEQWRF